MRLPGNRDCILWVRNLVATAYHEKQAFTDKHCRRGGKGSGDLLETGGPVLCGYLFLLNEIS